MTHDKLLHHCIISTVEKLHVGDTPEHGEKCSLKRHFLGCPREVVGYLDNEAKRNPRRFVWVKVDRIVKNALKWEEGVAREQRQRYTRREVLRALKFLREIHVISPFHLLEIDGEMRYGFVVASHDAVTVRLRNRSRCRLIVHKAKFHIGSVGIWLSPDDLARRVPSGMPLGSHRPTTGTQDEA